MPSRTYHLTLAARNGSGLIRARRVLRVVAAVLAMTALASGPASAAAQDAVVQQREYNVKAVSLYAFGRYVTWPDAVFPTPQSPFIIGVLGGNPFGDALIRIAAKKTLNGRPLQIRVLTSLDQVGQCQIVFLTRMVSREVEAEVAQLLRGKPILLVGETPGFANRGGVINFYQSGANVHFELNPDRGAESQLSLDAKLLSLGAKAPAR